MKYRNKFAVNSIGICLCSVSYQTAFQSILLAIILAFLIYCIISEYDISESKTFLQKTLMPDDTKKIKLGSKDPVWLYSHLVQRTKDGLSIIKEPTKTIIFDIGSTGGWIKKGDEQNLDNWRAVAIYAVKPDNAQNPPKSITIKSKVKYGLKTYTQDYTFEYEA